MSVLRQALCTAIICNLCLCLGIMYTWPSSTIKIFSSTNTTLNRPMTESELSLFGSLSSISALIGTLFAGLLLDVLGRKKSCLLFSLPQVIAWSIVCVSHTVAATLAAAFVSGLGGCALLIAPVYASEICQENIRGMMSSGSIIFYGIGMLVSYLLGGFLEYNMMNYTCLTLSAVSTVLMLFVADSPTYLMKKGSEMEFLSVCYLEITILYVNPSDIMSIVEDKVLQIEKPEEAAKAIAFYRATKVDSKVVVEEMHVIRRALNPEMDDDTPEHQNLKSDNKPDNKPVEKLSFWKFMKKSRSTRNAFIVCIILYSAAIFQGLVVVQVYAEPLFDEAVPSISATISSVILAIITVVAGFVAAYMVDVAGRRPLMLYSSICAAICCVVLGTQIQFHWGPHWITALFIYMYCIAYTFGAGTVPFVLIPEVFLPEVRSIASMLTVEWAWICNFVILFIFNPLVSAVGLGPVFYLFAGICILSAVFTALCLPETKGLPVDVIQTLFAKKRGRPGA